MPERVVFSANIFRYVNRAARPGFGHDAFFALAQPLGAPQFVDVFNRSKGGDPMSSDFVFQNVASADCPFGKQPS